MVFFTCNNCGESVKKAAVENHYNQKRCRSAVKNVSCMDCQKDFHGEEYVAHIKCITEMEKYSGKDYVPKEPKNSGAKKQESWMDIIRNILETSEYNLTAEMRNAFQKLQSVDNVPRKKAKFQNFASKCMRLSKPLAAKVWDVLEKELEKMKQSRMPEATPAKVAAPSEKQHDKEGQKNGIKRAALPQNGNEEPAKKKSKKQKKTEEILEEVSHNVDNDNAVAVATNGTEETFDWSSTLEKLVAKHAEGITLDKLKKKLLKKYRSKLGIEALTGKQQKKFEKKFGKHLKKSPALQVDGEVAKPC